MERSIELIESGVMICGAVLAICLLAQAVITLPAVMEENRAGTLVAQSQAGPGSGR